jgi:hypothetical protein
MRNPVNSILINENDNVATALVELLQGDVGRYISGEKIVEIVIMETIPQYHKYAIRDIQENEQVRKYGESIGLARDSIALGAHVHDHNIKSPGGDKA